MTLRYGGVKRARVIRKIERRFAVEGVKSIREGERKTKGGKSGG